MKRKLSYSSYNSYTTCPEMYRLRHKERITTLVKSSALTFGSALDKALNHAMLGEDWRTPLPCIVNEAIQDSALDVRDIDVEIIPDDQLRMILGVAKELGYGGDLGPFDFLASLVSDKSGDYSPNVVKVLSLAMRESMIAKIGLMVEKWQTNVRPQIDHFIEIQKETDHGIIDFVAKLKDGRVVIGDNKSSSRPYAEDAVRTSVQLAGYGATHAMYVVFNKNIKKNRSKKCTKCGTYNEGRHTTCAVIVGAGGKRCRGEFIESILPEAVVQVLIDEIPEGFRDKVKEAYRDVATLIKTGCFPKNLNACANQYGRPCDYFNLCHGGSMAGLKKEEK